MMARRPVISYCIKMTSLESLADSVIYRIRVFRSADSFSDQEISRIISEATAVIRPLPFLLELNAPITLFGDIHGQLSDLLSFWSLVDHPPEAQWLFLGDYVDRCKKGLEVLLLLLCYKLKFPSRVHLLRGNHECLKINRRYGFYTEMKRKRNTSMWRSICRLFDELPLCARVSGSILCMHGGLSPNLSSWEALRAMKKPKTIRETETSVSVDLLWADPANDNCYYGKNAIRSISHIFGHLAVEDTCRALGIALIIRAHEAVTDGFRYSSNGRVLTLFSAPNYCGTECNAGAVLKLSGTLSGSFVTLNPRGQKKTEGHTVHTFPAEPPSPCPADDPSDGVLAADFLDLRRSSK